MAFAAGLDLYIWLLEWIVNTLESLLNKCVSIGVISSILKHLWF